MMWLKGKIKTTTREPGLLNKLIADLLYLVLEQLVLGTPACLVSARNHVTSICRLFRTSIAALPSTSQEPHISVCWIGLRSPTHAFQV
jgi:hypothetical protein